MHTAPHTTPAARLTVGQHESTEDKVSLARMFPVGITERTWDQWKILAMTLWQLPCPLTVPLHRHSSAFLLCTLYPCSSCTGSVSSCLCNPAALSPFMGYCHRLFVFPCIQEVISRRLLLQRRSDYLLLLFKLLLKAKRKKQDCQRRVVLTFKIFWIWVRLKVLNQYLLLTIFLGFLIKAERNKILNTKCKQQD